MAITGAPLLSPILALARLLLSLFKRESGHPERRLEARMVMRGIVAELPDDIPFYICNKDGVRHKGVYVIGLFLWNRGNQPVTAADLIASAPLHISLGSDAKVVGERTIPVEDQTVCSTTIVNENTLAVTFDCINPKEYLVIPIFLTGNPMTEVKVTGRIVGQETPIDHTAEEVRPDLGERFANLFILLFIINVIPGLICGWLIVRDHGVSALVNVPQSVPGYMTASFGLGTALLAMFVIARVMTWLERQKVPEGYPLFSDLEPPLLENIKGMINTVFLGKKQRVSVSIFDWGKPILLPSKKVRRRTVDDWIAGGG